VNHVEKRLKTELLLGSENKSLIEGKRMTTFSNPRRDFLKRSIYFGATAVVAGPLDKALSLTSARLGSKMKFGLVTYQWGKDWALATLIANCEKTKVLGVELRTEHAHRVESDLNAQQRREVKKRFDDSSVTLVGLGTNFAFHHVDNAKLERDIEGAKQYIKLSHDVGLWPTDSPGGSRLMFAAAHYQADHGRS